MARISDEQRDRLRGAVQSHEYLRRIVRELEKLQRLVFHLHAASPDKLRPSAEEILIADIIMRHRGNFDGVYFALRAAEDAGRTWDQAIGEYAAAAHAYYTTPLGLLIRRDLFGDGANFISPLASQFVSAVDPQARPTPPS